MATAIVEIDLSTYEAIKRRMGELDEFKKKWPKDYKDRIGYMDKAERILELLPYAFKSK